MIIILLPSNDPGYLSKSLIHLIEVGSWLCFDIGCFDDGEIIVI